MKDKTTVKIPGSGNGETTIQVVASVPATVLDAGKVQMGAYSPAFPASREK